MNEGALSLLSSVVMEKCWLSECQSESPCQPCLVVTGVSLRFLVFLCIVKNAVNRNTFLRKQAFLTFRTRMELKCFGEERKVTTLFPSVEFTLIFL